MINDNTQNLKKELIEALEKLQEKSPYRSQITVILTTLSKEEIIIPPSDSENVLRFVLNLMESMPTLLDNNEGDQALKALCLECIGRLNPEDVIKPQFGR